MTDGGEPFLSVFCSSVLALRYTSADVHFYWNKSCLEFMEKSIVLLPILLTKYSIPANISPVSIATNK